MRNARYLRLIAAAFSGAPFAAARRMRWSSELLSDFRYGVRLLRRSPGFTFVAVTSLALGIAGAATVFSLVNAIVLRPLPVANPHELFLVNTAGVRSHGDLVPALVVDDVADAIAGQAEACAATSIAAMQLWPAGDTAAERGRVQLVSGNYFDVLRQRPQLGRLLQASDNARAGARSVAVISDAYWRRHFDASSSVIGTTLTINSDPFTVVGVAPRGFFGTTVGVQTPDAWIPFQLQPIVHYGANASNANGDTSQPWPPQRQISWLTLFVRIPKQTPAASIASAISVVLQRNAMLLLPQTASQQAEQRARETRATLESAAGGVSSLRNATAAPLLVLFAMVGVLLAISCGNVAGLLLSRASSREREVAIRASIGAGRTRILRQFLAESLLLGLGAGVVGLSLAVWLHEPLLRLFVAGATTIDLDTGVDWRVLLFVAAVSIATGVLCGVVPALRGSRVALAESLKQHSRAASAGGRRGLMTGRALVAAQMAFSLLLLIVAGLFGRSLESLARIDVGYDRDHLLVASIDVRASYPAEQRLALYGRLIDRLQRIPGIESASLSENGPINRSAWRSSFAVEGYTPGSGESLTTNEEVVAGDYFRTVGLRLLEGRLFDAQDRHPGRGRRLSTRPWPGASFRGRARSGSAGRMVEPWTRPPSRLSGSSRTRGIARCATRRRTWPTIPPNSTRTRCWRTSSFGRPPPPARSCSRSARHSRRPSRACPLRKSFPSPCGSRATCRRIGSSPSCRRRSVVWRSCSRASGSTARFRTGSAAESRNSGCGWRSARIAAACCG